jgi:hypothetical protein
MHTAPWYEEAMPPDTPPMLRMLRGDFFCAPFGPNDGPGGGPQHGLPASNEWHLTAEGEGFVELVLDVEVMGAKIVKRVEVRPGETVVYQRHVLAGGSGRLPVGQHAMLRAGSPLHLGFAPHVFAGTPPTPLETPPEGRSILAYPQALSDLRAARRMDGGTTDLTCYPAEDGHEDLWMLASEPSLAFGWTAATCPADGWVWFGLKDTRTLPETIVWESNGGRSYPPFSSRHRGVIGLEEVCSYFHLGLTASTAPNPVSDLGIPTAVTLAPDGAVTIPLHLRRRRDPRRLRRGDGHRRGGWRHPAPRRGRARDLRRLRRELRHQPLKASDRNERGPRNDRGPPELRRCGSAQTIISVIASTDVSCFRTSMIFVPRAMATMRSAIG